MLPNPIIWNSAAFGSGGGGGGGSSDSFFTIQTDLGTAPVATSPTDTLTLTSSILSITGDSGTDTVTFGILNGVLTNAMVSSSAAIDGTKISPNFGSQNVVTTGNGTFAGLFTTDTDGTGILNLANQASPPSTPSSSLSLLADSTARLLMIGPAGNRLVLDHLSISANRTFTFPDLSGTFLLDTTPFSAHTMRANNTSSSAAPTEQVFNSPTIQTVASTITWTGTTAPSGSTNHQYSWSQVGNRVTYNFSLRYSVAGSTLQAVAIEKPSDMPDPLEISGLTAASENLYALSGSFNTATSGTGIVTRGNLRRNSGDTAYEFFIQTGTGTGAYLTAKLTGSYTVA